VWTWKNDVLGFLMAGYGGGGCVCDGQIVITRAGSGLKQEGPPGPDGVATWVQVTDHRYRHSPIQGVLGAIANKDVFILMASNTCDYLPSIIPDKQFYVIGNYRAVFAWAEKRNGHVCIRFKAQAVDLSKRSWFANVDSAPPTIKHEEISNLVCAERQTCADCGQESPMVYRSGWVCLNLRHRDDTPACPAAEQAQDQLPDREKDILDYRFLAERIDFAGLSTEEFVAPTPAEAFVNLSDEKLAQVELKDIPHGTTCLKCKTAIMRVSLQGYFCKCNNYSVHLPVPIVPLEATTDRSPIHPADRKLEVMKSKCECARIQPTFTAFRHRITPVILRSSAKADEHKPLYFCLPTPDFATTFDGPDLRYHFAMQAMNSGAMKAERRLLKDGDTKVKGTHTQYFTWQAGQQYNYKAHHQVSEDIPAFVRTTWNSLKTFAQNVVGESYRDMDEIMFNLYLPNGEIGAHPDHGTTGYILSQSLGADGFFEINTGKGSDKVLVRVKMPHGAIVLMPGDEFQKDFKHRAWTHKTLGPRINVSLRAVKQSDEDLLGKLKGPLNSKGSRKLDLID
jgi:alkylated DNA repair dioxygenase AlkB